MNWAIELSSSAIKDLKKLPRDRREQIARAIDEMESDPATGDVIPLKGREWENHYRKRVGPYRIIFVLDRKSMTVNVSAILVRSEKTYR